jgi:hypothetical protein
MFFYEAVLESILKRRQKDMTEEIKRITARPLTTDIINGVNTSTTQAHPSRITTDFTQSCIKTVTDSNISSKNQIEQLRSDLRQEVEKLTKIYNNTISLNQKKRTEINSLRKERNLYDHVFRNIEYQILEEEKNLMSVLKKHQELNIYLKEAEENLSNLMETISKTSYDDFFKTLKKEQDNYESNVKNEARTNNSSMLSNMQQSAHQENLNEKSLMHAGSKRFSTINVHGSRRNILTNNGASTPNISINQNQLRILLIENMVQEFKYRTEENKYDELLDLFEHGKEKNDYLYQQFIAQEEEVD